MDDPGGSSYFIALLCLLLSAFFSGSESAIFSSDEVKLKSAYSGSKKVQRVLGLKKNLVVFSQASSLAIPLSISHSPQLLP